MYNTLFVLPSFPTSFTKCFILAGWKSPCLCIHFLDSFGRVSGLPSLTLDIEGTSGRDATHRVICIETSGHGLNGRMRRNRKRHGWALDISRLLRMRGYYAFSIRHEDYVLSSTCVTLGCRYTCFGLVSYFMTMLKFLWLGPLLLYSGQFRSYDKFVYSRARRKKL